MSEQLIFATLSMKKPRLRMVNLLIQGQSQRGQILEPESTKVFATGEVHAM